MFSTILENIERTSSNSLSAMQSSSNISVISAHKRSSDTLETLEKALSDSRNLQPCQSGAVFSILDKTACCEAISSMGVILPPEEAIGTPGEPKLSQATSTSLTLSWDPPPTVQTANNINSTQSRIAVTGYTVFVYKALQQQQCQQFKCSSDPIIKVGGLTRGTTYLVSVRAESDGIYGRNSPVVALSTPNSMYSANPSTLV
ncbi:hypothetical protein Pelo_19505 [Pelomyxa schiedti]|nr:hypothetical protein Pelo_19505 [Pelomyxa schiedti]